MCPVERVDQKPRPSGGIAWIIDSYCTRIDQFSPVAGYRWRTGCRIGCAGAHAGDVDGAVAVPRSVSGCLGGGRGRLLALLRNALGRPWTRGRRGSGNTVVGATRGSAGTGRGMAG